MGLLRGSRVRRRPPTGRTVPVVLPVSSSSVRSVVAVSLGSFSKGALFEVTVADVDRMLELDETLFIEHKLDIEKGAVKLMRAVAGFANTAGGWVLLGVSKGKIVANGDSLWARRDALPLVDLVRDRLRGRLDPLPAFEARVMNDHPDGPVGVIRVYESSDTPHIDIGTGVVWVREVAGTAKAEPPQTAPKGREARRLYRDEEIRSRAQLLELTNRGRTAQRRVEELVNTAMLTPAVASVGFHFEAHPDVRAVSNNGGALFLARLAPYSLSPRFRPWATTHAASGAVIRAAERFSDRHGLTGTWVDPHPAGASIRVPIEHPPHRPRDRPTVDPVRGEARVSVDGIGVASAALWLEGPDPQFVERYTAQQVADDFVRPTLKAASEVLAEGEFVGRCRCQIDLIGVQEVLFVENQGDHNKGDPWVPLTADVTLPADEEDLALIALRAAYAYARSASLHFWDKGP